MRLPSLSPGARLWIDRALCALLTLLSVVALVRGLWVRNADCLLGFGALGLVGACWSGRALFDRAALSRQRAVRAALAQALRSRERSP